MDKNRKIVQENSHILHFLSVEKLNIYTIQIGAGQYRAKAGLKSMAF